MTYPTEKGTPENHHRQKSAVYGGKMDSSQKLTSESSKTQPHLMVCKNKFPDM